MKAGRPAAHWGRLAALAQSVQRLRANQEPPSRWPDDRDAHRRTCSLASSNSRAISRSILTCRTVQDRRNLSSIRSGSETVRLCPPYVLSRGHSALSTNPLARAW